MCIIPINAYYGVKLLTIIPANVHSSSHTFFLSCHVTCQHAFLALYMPISQIMIITSFSVLFFALQYVSCFQTIMGCSKYSISMSFYMHIFFYLLFYQSAGNFLPKAVWYIVGALSFLQWKLNFDRVISDTYSTLL